MSVFAENAKGAITGIGDLDGEVDYPLQDDREGELRSQRQAGVKEHVLAIATLARPAHAATLYPRNMPFGAARPGPWVTIGPTGPVSPVESSNHGKRDEIQENPARHGWHAGGRRSRGCHHQP